MRGHMTARVRCIRPADRSILRGFGLRVCLCRGKRIIGGCVRVGEPIHDDYQGPFEFRIVDFKQSLHKTKVPIGLRHVGIGKLRGGVSGLCHGRSGASSRNVRGDLTARQRTSHPRKGRSEFDRRRPRAETFRNPNGRPTLRARPPEALNDEVPKTWRPIVPLQSALKRYKNFLFNCPGSRQRKV
jgi:hypothetical protein